MFATHKADILQKITDAFLSRTIRAPDKASVPLFEFTVSAPTFETDEDGYLVKVIDDKSTYEFYYDGETP